MSLGLIAIAICAAVLEGQTPTVRVTYLYDNTAATAGVKPDWGFACLVQGSGRTVLFDTGANASILRENLGALKIDPGSVDALVLSHDHDDHTQGLDALGRRPGLPVYYAQGFAPEVVARLTAAGLRLTPVSRSVPIFPGFAVSDEMGVQAKIVEDALLVETTQGLVVIVGCAHPGIIPMLRQIKETSGRPIYMVLGGFHLLQTPAERIKQIVADFKTMGIAYAGPTHCTGDEAIKQFRQAYGDHFISGGVGTVVEAPVPAKRRP
jgi:7,8-dihydropterin-6-yl-methyl-4-(beta-D-ribofuranosyl)aminobenzene 5'-phosphate synthase